jgi:tight adherence protein B
MEMILIFGIGFAMVILVVGVLITVREERSLVEDRLGKYMKEEQERRGQPKQRGLGLSEWANTRIEKFSWGSGIAKELARADIKLKVGEFIAMAFGISALMAFWLGYFGWLLDLRRAALWDGRFPAAHLHQYAKGQAPGALQQPAGGYAEPDGERAAGGLLDHAGDGGGLEGAAGADLGGVPAGGAGDAAGRDDGAGAGQPAARIPSLDLDLVITAMNVQREVGGNLAEILATISHTIRERVRVKGEIRVLTAQQVYSGRFLSAITCHALLVLVFVESGIYDEFLEEETNSLVYALGFGLV